MSCAIISNRSLASLASSTPMIFACSRSSDTVLGDKSFICRVEDGIPKAAQLRFTV